MKNINMKIFGKCSFADLELLALFSMRVELADGTSADLEWDSGDWQTEEGKDIFCIDIFDASTESPFVDADKLKSIKRVTDLVILSDIVPDPYTFSIDEIEIAEGDLVIGKIKPEVGEIIFDTGNDEEE